MNNNITKNVKINNNNIIYKIFDPTKNITILVESDVGLKDQPTIAKALMQIHPNVEQVGFVSFDENKNIKLRMAGGEFCGNATMCAGVYAVIIDEIYKTKFTKDNKNILDKKCFKEKSIDDNNYKNNNKFANFTKTIYVESLKKYVDVDIKCIDENKFIGTVNMPRAKEINNIKFPDGEIYDVVRLQGISHIIIDIINFDYKKLYIKINNENYFDSDDSTNGSNNIVNFDATNMVLKNYFENKIKSYCDFLNVESLGIIFYDKNKNSITPLVYVKNADTLYWENSCASGSIAVYEYLKIKNAELSILQPCNEYLKIFEKNNKLYLSGEVRTLS